MFKKGFVLVLMMLGIAHTAVAQSDEVMRLRVVNLVNDTAALYLMVDGEPLGSPTEAILVSDYLTMAAGSVEITLTADEGTSSMPLANVTLEGESGHDYALIIRGSVAGDTVAITVIDETAGRASLDAQTQAPLLFIHDLPNAPAVTLMVNGEPVLENVAYGDVVSAGLPIGDVEEVLLTAADDPDNVLLAPPFFVRFLPTVGWTLALYGTYPGEPREDYRFLPIPAFLGEVTETVGGDLVVGTPIDGMIQTGERVLYTLTVEQDSTFDILVASPDGSVDPYVAVRDEQGALIAENDELNYEDDVLDAGFAALALPTGTYTISAGSFRDADTGSYQLTITAGT